MHNIEPIYYNVVFYYHVLMIILLYMRKEATWIVPKKSFVVHCTCIIIEKH